MSRITLLNPPHRSIGSRVPGELLPPLGLLQIGGPLIDAGHAVRLINADIAPMDMPAILAALQADPPDILMLGHSGSTSAHPTCLQITAAVRAALPGVTIVYGGVYPSYHWQDILTEAPQIDIIVRGEGEVTVVALAQALALGTPLDTIPGLAFRRDGQPFATPPAPMIRGQHGMIGLCTFGVGFEEETDADYWRMLRHLLAYDPDQIMSVFATPHRWTPFHGQSAQRRVIRTDLRLWDYKHQVMETPRVPARRVFLWVKLIEATLQLRPKALWRAWLQPDPTLRHAQRWYSRMGARVWLHEIRDAILYRTRPGPTVGQFWGQEQLPEQALSRARPTRLDTPVLQDQR